MKSLDDLLHPLEVRREYPIGINRLRRMNRAHEVGRVPVGKWNNVISRRAVDDGVARNTIPPASTS